MSDEDNNSMGPVMVRSWREDATPEIQAVADRPEIKEAAINALQQKHHENKLHQFTEAERLEQLSNWKVTQYAEEQTAYGVNYFMKVSIGHNLFIHIRVQRQEDDDAYNFYSLHETIKDDVATYIFPEVFTDDGCLIMFSSQVSSFSVVLEIEDAVTEVELDCIVYDGVQLKSQLLNAMILNGESMFNHLNEYANSRTKTLKMDIHHRVSSYRKILLQNRQRSSSTKNIMGVCLELYLDVMSNPFNMNEWIHLSLGRSIMYTIKSQCYSSSTSTKNLRKKEHSNINQKVVHYLGSPPRNIPSRTMMLKTFSNDLLNYFNHAYFTPPPYKDQTEALTQAIAALSIRRKIFKFNLILCVTDKSHNFYIGSAIEFENKIEAFFLDTNVFMILTGNPFNGILNKVIQLLNRLREKQLILQWQNNKMMPYQTKSVLTHLYFNLKTHKIGIPVRRTENTIGAPTTDISDFLDEIIRPIFDRKCGPTSIIDGVYLLKELYKYTKKGLF
ncbi:unnamed protein product [Rotaria magnacalcarata]